MGLDPSILTAISIGTSVLTGGAQIMMAQSAAQAQAEAANRNTEAAYRELGIRQQEAIDKASQEKSDRAAQADRELAAIRVAMGESGGLGTVTAYRTAVEAGASEGLDISRIEANRDREIAALQRSKEAAQMTGQNTASAAARSAQNAAISGVMNIAGSGLQIYSGYRRDQAMIEAQKQRVPPPPKS